VGLEFIDSFADRLTIGFAIDLCYVCHGCDGGAMSIIYDAARLPNAVHSDISSVGHRRRRSRMHKHVPTEWR